MSLSITTGACFPGNPKAQRYAKVTEGALLLTGVGMLYFVNSGADCDAMGMPGMPDSNCQNKATVLGDIGLGLILTGLLGFIATVSTSDEDKKTETTALPAPPPPPNAVPAKASRPPAAPAPAPAVPAEPAQPTTPAEPPPGA